MQHATAKSQFWLNDFAAEEGIYCQVSGYTASPEAYWNRFKVNKSGETPSLVSWNEDTMSERKLDFKTEKELEEIILQEKAKGTPDLEIGQKYRVTFRYIERLITKSQGVNISAFKVSKKPKKLYPKDFEEEQTTVWSFK